MGEPEKCKWVDDSDGNHPKFSISAGMDKGEKLYVARAKINGEKVPGKLHPSHKCVYVAYDGKEISKNEYQVLIAPTAVLSWVHTSGGDIPENSLKAGKDPNTEEKMYVGRVIHNGTVTVGKVHPSHGKCYIPYDGEEHGYDDYEILKINDLGKFLGVKDK